MSAVKYYQPDKKEDGCFEGFLYMCAYQKWQRELSYARNSKNRHSLIVSMDDDTNKVKLKEKVEETLKYIVDYDNLFDGDYVSKIKTYTRRLPSRRARVVIASILANRTIRETATRLRISKQRVNELYNEAVNYMQVFYQLEDHN